MLANRSMPPGTIIAELGYADVVLAAAWLCESFGFRERLRIGNHRAQIVFGDTSIVVVHNVRAPAWNPNNVSPAATAGGCRLMVRVSDIDAHHARARSRGTRILHPPTDQPYGERQYSAQDPGGHSWVFSQSIADVNPADWGGELVER
ncbi:MAG: VOC family protein [Tahibacter sp.]